MDAIRWVYSSKSWTEVRIKIRVCNYGKPYNLAQDSFLELISKHYVALRTLRCPLEKWRKYYPPKSHSTEWLFLLSHPCQII